jgi:hypothetical protein
MRPKIVIIILLLGVGGLVLIGVLHEKLGKPVAENPVAGSGGVPAELTNTPTVELAKPEVSPIQPEVKLAVTNVIATTTDEDRAAQKEKDLNAISDALVSGNNDSSGAIQAIGSRLENAEEEVRTAAREAAVHFGDTNVIPYLTSALEHLKDPREKVAIMDAIAYLRLPSASDNLTNGTEILPAGLNKPGVKAIRR